MARSISVLLTTYNRLQDTIKCLNKLEEQWVPGMEVFVLDDYHLRNDILETFCVKKRFKYVHTGMQKDGKVHWRVPGFALNIGAKMAEGDYYIIGGAEIYHMSKFTFLSMKETEVASAPVIYDEPKDSRYDYHTYEKLNNKLPFCFGLPADIYHTIGGYDEDFTGYCFDDNDFSDRVLSMTDFVTVDAEAIHLWNPRGAENRGDTRITNRAWNHNRQLYMNRKNILVRNEGKDWGVL